MWKVSCQIITQIDKMDFISSVDIFCKNVKIFQIILLYHTNIYADKRSQNNGTWETCIAKKKIIMILQEFSETFFKKYRVNEIFDALNCSYYLLCFCLCYRIKHVNILYIHSIALYYLSELCEMDSFNIVQKETNSNNS